MLNSLIRKLYLLTGYSFGKKVVLGRTACLGKEIFSRVYPNQDKYILINQQKVRTDLFLQGLKNGLMRVKSYKVKKYLARKDIMPFLREQECLPWLKVKSDIEFILIDSLAELVDQKFVNKNRGWSFCCFYSDLIVNTSDFNQNFDCLGFLDLDLIEKKYRDFFDWIGKNFPNKIILFIHYSTKLDGREKFTKRQQEISRVLKKLAIENSNIKNIELDDSLINFNKNDKLPYHYSEMTNSYYADEWKRVCGISNQSL